jgi:hypothetical protein
MFFSLTLGTADYAALIRHHGGIRFAQSAQRLRSPKRLYAFGIAEFEISPRHLQIVMGLEIQPKLRAVTEVKDSAAARCQR